MPKLQREARDNHLARITAKLDAAGIRLGVPIENLVPAINRSPEMAAFSGAYMKVDSGVWACDAMIYAKFHESDKSDLGFYATCEISWGSYAHKLNSALTAISTYQRAVEMAAIIEGLIS